MTLESFLENSGEILSAGGPTVFGVAAVAGVIASAVCPCTLPVGLGMAGIVGTTESHSPRSGMVIAGSFFVGIVVNLAVLGALAGRVGAILTEAFGRYWTFSMALVAFAAAVAAFLGPRLNVEQLARLRRPGLGGAFLYGFIFSLGTSAAPLLVLLAVTVGKGSVLYGMLLAVAFGVGRGLPFLIVGLFSGAVLRFARVSAFRHGIQIASGCALVLLGLYYVQAFIGLL